MKCEDIKIDDYLDRRLMISEQLAVEQHIAKCSACASKLESAESLLLALRDLPLPAPSNNFEQRVFAEVRRQYKKQPRQQHRFNFASGFATAAVASLAIWFVSSIYIPEIQTIEQPASVSITMNQPQTVRLMFDSEKEIQLVKLSIDLPDNMELDGYPGRNSLSWQTSLHKGQNVLALPVMAVKSGEGELLARLSYGDKLKTFRLVLKTNMDGVQRYQLNEIKPV